MQSVAFLKLFLHFAGTIISVSLLSVVFAIHAYFKDLQSSFGKCSMLFVLGLTLTYAALPLCNHQRVMVIRFLSLLALCIGFSFSFVWMTAMIIDNAWTFKWEKSTKYFFRSSKIILNRNFRASHEDGISFKAYCICAFGLTFLILSTMTGIFFKLVSSTGSLSK